MRHRLPAIVFASLLTLIPHVLAQGPPTFGQPTISGIQGVGFEQDLRLDPTNPNRAYTSVPGALSSDTSWIWHSEDAGKTFKWLTVATAKEGKPTSCGGGGDTELAVDSGGNLYFNDLTLANFSTARSENHGVSFTDGVAGDCSNTAVPDTPVDRQWYATDGDALTGGNIYLSNDEVGTGGVQCGNSITNNVLVMYRSPLPLAPFTAGVQFGPPFRITQPLSCDEGIMGDVEVSPVTHHIFVVHDNATFDKIAIGRCMAVPFSATDPSGLRCVDLPVASFPGSKTGGNFPTLAIDRAGNLYTVWEQAPVNTNGQITGDTVLRYSYSKDEGTTWSTPITIPTPALHNNVFAWAAAGDDGRVNIAWYGTPTMADPNNAACGTNGGGTGGPDATTNGIWSLYMVQTLNGHSTSPAFTSPILAGEHYNHKGTIQTVMGGQCGDRTLGDFLQLRIGSRGEAQISYADSNNPDESSAPHATYVKQNSGTGVFANRTVTGDPILLNAATDPAGDGKRETDGFTSANMPNLDILSSSFAQPAPANCHPSGTPCYRIKMTINNLSLTPPAPDLFAVWLTQWLVPADPNCNSTSPLDDCHNGGKNPFVYLKSDGTCWSGENAEQRVGGGVTLTYPGDKQIIAPGACSYVLGPFGTITIDVPIADVSLASGTAPLSNRLYSVTASTMTLIGPPEDPPAVSDTFVAPNGTRATVRRLGGQIFDLIDVVRAYDFVPGAGGGGGGGGCQSDDGNGDDAGDKGGKAHFNFHHDNCNQQPDSADFSDSGSGTDFHATQFTSVTRDDAAHTVTIAGLGTNNGLPVTFTIVAVDSTLVPPGLFSITLSDGYSNSGNLLDGSVALH